MLRGFLTFSDWTTSVPDTGLGDATDLVGSADNDGAPAAPQAGFGRRDVFMNSKWSLNVNGLYEIAPDRPWAFNVAGDLYGRQGFVTPATFSDVSRVLQTDARARPATNAAVHAR